MNHATTYRPGDGLAIVTPRLALLTVLARFEAIERVWWLAASGEPDVPAILDALGQDGIAKMPRFALAVRTGDVISLVLRSGFVAAVEGRDGARTLSADGIETWTEHRIEHAAGARLSVAGGASAADARPLPIEAGVVRASAVTLGAVTSSSAAPEPAPPAPVAPEPEPDPPAPVAPEPEPEPGAPAPVTIGPTVEREPETPAHVTIRPAPVPPVAPEPRVTLTWENERSAPPAPTPVDPAATLTEPEDSRFDAMFGATIAGRRPEDAAVRGEEDATGTEAENAAPAPPITLAAPRLGDHDDRTITRSRLRRERAKNAAAEEARPASGGPVIRLVLSNGREVIVDRPVLIGRAPQARNASGATLPTLVKVDDEFVSSTHLALRPDDGTLVVTDVSSNGTVLKRADAPAVPMRKGEPTAVADGAVLQISDTISISVIIS